MRAGHALEALGAISFRELRKFMQQRSRLLSALVRPLLWLVVFAAGFRNVFGVAVIEPYSSFIEYQVYVAPGLLGMICLFNGIQSSLAMVYDREMGLMRLLLTAPLPRGWLLAFKLLAGTSLSLLQMAVFLAIAWGFGSRFELAHAPGMLLAMVCGATLLASRQAGANACALLAPRVEALRPGLRAQMPAPTSEMTPFSIRMSCTGGWCATNSRVTPGPSRESRTSNSSSSASGSTRTSTWAVAVDGITFSRKSTVPCILPGPV